MGLLRREKRVIRPVAGRALVVPLSTGNAGGGHDDTGSFNNWSNSARVKSFTVLRPLEAADGQPVDTTQTRVKAHLPNWLRMIMYFAGSNDEDGEHFPDQITVPVVLDAEARTVVEIDVDLAMAEYEQYREAAIRVWKENEAPLAPVRNMIKLPGAIARGTKEFVADWKGAIGDIGKSSIDADKPPSPKEHEQHRRTAQQLRLLHERDPKAGAAAREAATTYGPQMARGVAAGSYPPHGFALWVELEEIKGALTAEEAAELRAIAGPPPS